MCHLTLWGVCRTNSITNCSINYPLVILPPFNASRTNVATPDCFHRLLKHFVHLGLLFYTHASNNHDCKHFLVVLCRKIIFLYNRRYEVILVGTRLTCSRKTICNYRHSYKKEPQLFFERKQNSASGQCHNFVKNVEKIFLNNNLFEVRSLKSEASEANLKII